MGVSDQLNQAVKKSASLLSDVKKVSINFGLASVLLAGGFSSASYAQEAVDDSVFLSGNDGLKVPLLQDNVFRVDYPMIKRANGTGPYYALQCSKNINPNVEIETYFAMDADTGATLVDHGGGMLIDPASMTKLMSLLIVHEAIEKGFDPNQNLYFQFKGEKEKAKNLGYRDGQGNWGGYVKASDAIKASALASYNDTTYLLAENVARFYGVGNTEIAFVQIMNERADQLGMINTKFPNSTGMPFSLINEEGEGSTTRDMAILLSYIVENHPDLVEVLGLKNAIAYAGGDPVWLETHNTFLKDKDNPFDKVIGKTGMACNSGATATLIFISGDKRVIVSYVGGRSWRERAERMLEIALHSYDKIDDNRARLRAYAESELHDQEILSSPESADFIIP